MRNTVENWHYSKETGIPSEDSMFEKFLNFVLPLMYKIVRAISSSVQMIFPTGVDGKKIIKE